MPYPRLTPLDGPTIPREALMFLVTREVVPVPLRQWEAERATVGELTMLMAALRHWGRLSHRDRVHHMHRVIQLVGALDRLYGLLPEPSQVTEMRA